jgi:EAL domain-containing protein (putative c-di-GMP-specific phosphodiesterase class I)
MQQTKWDAMSRLATLTRACREVEALWLADAMTGGDFFVEFQPIFDLRSGDVLGYEGLLRSRSANGEARLAAEIFPAAEALGSSATSSASRGPSSSTRRAASRRAHSCS